VGHGELLASNGELVHLEAADLLVLRDVLGGLTHGDVDIGKSGLRRPRLVGAFGALRRSFHGVGEEFIGGLALSEAPLAKRDTVSTPAATKTSPSPARIACAAMRMVCSDDEQ